MFVYILESRHFCRFLSRRAHFCIFGNVLGSFLLTLVVNCQALWSHCSDFAIAITAGSVHGKSMEMRDTPSALRSSLLSCNHLAVFNTILSRY